MSKINFVGWNSFKTMPKYTSHKSWMSLRNKTIFYPDGRKPGPVRCYIFIEINLPASFTGKWEARYTAYPFPQLPTSCRGPSTITSACSWTLTEMLFLPESDGWCQGQNSEIPKCWIIFEKHQSCLSVSIKENILAIWKSCWFRTGYNLRLGLTDLNWFHSNPSWPHSTSMDLI